MVDCVRSVRGIRFINLFDAPRKISDGNGEYNEQMLHTSLGNKTPAEFLRVTITQSYGKDPGSAHLANASGVSQSSGCGLNSLNRLQGIRDRSVANKL